MKDKYITLTCKICKRKFKKDKRIYDNDKRRGINAGKFCSKECFYKSPERSPNQGRKGKDSFGWKGGRIYERGYKMIVCPDQNHPYGVIKGGGVKYIREHRYVMEQHLGRYLTKEEVVHHINENPLDIVCPLLSLC